MGAPSRAISPPSRPLLLGAPWLLALFALLLASPAEAAAPLKVREVYPGSVAEPGAEYVELQMTAPGQSDVSGQSLVFYDPSGTVTATYVLPGDVASGQSQRSVLLATAAAKDGLGLPAPDFDLPAGDALDPTAGAACFTGALPPDCATWGSLPIFSPIDPFPNVQAANAPAIADESALRRSIAPGCPTMLEETDDTDNGAVDFATTPPGPSNNAAIPGESPCPPETTVGTFPANPTNQAAASFTYSAHPNEGGVTFRCSIDDPVIVNFTDCTAGATKSYSGLVDGAHTFRVYAIGPGGADPTPASYTWTVDTVSPDTFIDAGPPSPSSGFTVSFSFRASEESSSFRCQLDGGVVQACTSPKSYINLASGTHLFSVYAVDNAGNQDPTPATFAFTVDNVIEDLTAPDTTILTGPPNPSPSEGAAFTYASNEEGSSFQCSLDGAAFSPCPATGISYQRLRNGRHTFQAKATDRAGNSDPVSATYVWTVAAPLPTVRIVAAPPGRSAIPKARAGKLTVTFKLKADKPGSSFRCRLDKGAFRPCKPTTRLRAGVGRHRFEAFAVDSLGNVGTKIERRIFRVVARKSGGLF